MTRYARFPIATALTAAAVVVSAGGAQVHHTVSRLHGRGQSWTS